MLQSLHKVVEFVALQHFLVHGEKRRARVFGQLDKILPAFGIVARVPHDRVHVFGDIALKPAHAVTEDEGGHVVFQAGEIVCHHEVSRLPRENSPQRKSSYSEASSPALDCSPRRTTR